jgi:hypothetical protein
VALPFLGGFKVQGSRLRQLRKSLGKQQILLINQHLGATRPVHGFGGPRAQEQPGLLMAGSIKISQNPLKLST